MPVRNHTAHTAGSNEQHAQAQMQPSGWRMRNPSFAEPQRAAARRGCQRRHIVDGCNECQFRCQIADSRVLATNEHTVRLVAIVRRVLGVVTVVAGSIVVVAAFARGMLVRPRGGFDTARMMPAAAQHRVQDNHQAQNG